MARAQGEATWSTPKRVPAYYDLLRAPVLVADQNHTVHAFNQEKSAGGGNVIAYRRWSAVSRDWSPPVDILLFGEGLSGMMGVQLDDSGRLHLIFYSGEETQGNVFYTWAYAAQAGSAAAWSEPVQIAPSAGPLVAGALIAQGSDRLVAVYTGLGQGVGVYAFQSVDGGHTWSKPATVDIVDTPENTPVAHWLTSDSQGRVHAVWHVANNAGQGEEIWYARLSADLVAWSQPILLAGRESDLENMGWGSIISVDDRLIVAYQDSFPATRWVRQSADGGETWGEPVRPFPHVGGYEYTALVKDSNNVVHMVLGNRFPSPETYGMWYSKLVEGVWTPLEPIISGPARPDFGPCCPRAVISQGNVLLATWAHNVNSEFLTGAWYAYLDLDAPELPVVPLQVPTALPAQATATPTAPAPSPAPTRSLGEPNNGAGTANPTDPATDIYLAVVPVVLIVLAVLGIQQLRRSREESGRPYFAQTHKRK
jgi:hypothetical protein